MAEPEARGRFTSLPRRRAADAAARPSPRTVAQISARRSTAAAHGILGRVKTWFVEEGPWWLCSFVFHIVLVCSLALMGGKVDREGGR